MKQFIGIVMAIMLIASVGYAATATKVLTWDNPTTNCDGSTYIDPYGTNIYMASTPTGPYTKIGSVLDPANTYTDTVTVPSNTTVQRCYMVRAVDQVGNESCADSNQVCQSFFGIDTLAPAGITNLR